MHQQQKHENQMREMIGQCESNIRELQQLQVNEGQHFSVLHVVVDLLVCVTTLVKVHSTKHACLALQNEKCHLLIENETQKLKHLDEQHNQLLKDWRDQLKPRKKVRFPVTMLLHVLHKAHS